MGDLVILHQTGDDNGEDPAKATAEWLYGLGYVLDWTTPLPPPRPVFEALVDLVGGQMSLTYDEALDYVMEEGGWKMHIVTSDDSQDGIYGDG